MYSVIAQKLLNKSIY